MFCKYCGKPTEDGEQFCASCGKSLNEEIKGNAVQENPFGTPVAELNLKKGWYAVFANVIAAVVMLSGLIWLFLSVLQFGNYSGGDKIIQLMFILLGLLLGLLSLFFPFLVKYIVFKAKGCKVKLHIGMLTELCATQPVSRNTYLLSDLLGLIPFVLFVVLAIVFQFSTFTATMLIVSAANTLAYIPAFVFLFRQKATSRFILERGVLRVYA